MTQPITVEYPLAGRLTRRGKAIASKNASLVGVAIGGGQMQHNRALTDSLLNEAASLGVQWIRTDCNWSWINGTKGSLNWAWMDYIRDGCKTRGLNMLLTLGTSPVWSRPSAQPETYGPTTSVEQDNFASFCTKAVNRYKNDVHYWEVWNEPNLDQFWTPTPSASVYATLLKNAYGAIKSADPTAIVVSGATGGAWRSPDIPSTTWWADLYGAGAKPYFDIAAHHPYIDDTQVPKGIYNTGEMFHSVEIRKTMNLNGDNDKPLWATEIGMPTSGNPAVTEDQQRTGSAGVRDLWFGRENNTKIFWFTLRDTAAYGAPGSTRENFFGFIRSDGTDKPAFADQQAWIGKE